MDFVFDRYITSKNGKYSIISEVVNPNSFTIGLPSGEEPIIFKNIITNKVLDDNDLTGIDSVNLKLMSTREFLESDFYKKHEINLFEELVKAYIKRTKGITGYKSFTKKNTLNFKLIKNDEFLKSDFVNKNIGDLFHTLKEIQATKDNEKNNTIVKKKLVKKG